MFPPFFYSQNNQEESMFYDDVFEDFEYVRDTLLDELPEKEEEAYKYEWCKDKLYET